MSVIIDKNGEIVANIAGADVAAGNCRYSASSVSEALNANFEKVLANASIGKISNAKKYQRNECMNFAKPVDPFFPRDFLIY